jgi:glycosyltransferase involved in cell wall biosynthesis
LRILVLSFYFRPDLAAGSFRTTALVDELVSRLPSGAELEVVTTLPNRYRTFSVEAPELECAGALTVHRIRLPAHASGMADQSRAFGSFAAGAERLTRDRRYDLVYATSSRLMTAVLGAWIARREHAKLYLDIRDIFVETIGDVLRPAVASLVSPVLSLLERYAIRRADHLNLVSEGFAPYFQKRYPHIQPTYFTNGIDPEFLGPMPAQPITTVSTAPARVLYAGNIGEGQGLHQVIPALALRMRDRVRFRVIGDGGRREALQAAVKNAGCSNVELLPPMGRDQLIQEYLDADVLFLHLNDLAAFEKVLPSKIFEYAATGKPIWAGVAGYAARFLEQNVENSAVFRPCAADEAMAVFNRLRLGLTPRIEFRERFSRQRITAAMADDLLRLAESDRQAVA